MVSDPNPESTPRKRGSRRAHFLSLAWAALVIALLLLPEGLWHGVAEVPGADLPGLDKGVHVLLFAGLAWLWSRSLALLGVARPGLVALVAAAALGGALELLQPLAARERDLADALANAAGAAAAVLLRRG